MGGTIVCGVTGTAAARDASELAAALAARLGLRLVLVHVSEDGKPGPGGAAGAMRCGSSRAPRPRLSPSWPTRVPAGGLVVGVADVAEVDPARRRVLLGTSVDLADAYLP